ncbi:nuclear transport factor 2 family protein [Bythopirellula goksoeyrii]|uniref:DUF4440 domain-containing protein n=1 Tax=Bythopirellula goksoeyrii TaxID=1400387 RepID=A0A5B9Q7E2_9BACT|nr:nuclear transport factor 2 family protein [Bythopirellula goksoeyrii]QEG34944.1 hypothetical protein Pr1d_22330 [Bythopirellula goksoeyrii]
MKIPLIAIAVILIFSSNSCLFADEPSELFIQLRDMDSTIFEEGFNKCNEEVLRSVLHEDLEFLHDLSGESEFDGFIKSIQENICSNPHGKLTRKVVPESLSVFPLKKDGTTYAAVQFGAHEFYFTPNGGSANRVSSGRFIHTYFLNEGEWKLKRVISYDHQSASPDEPREIERPPEPIRGAN